MSRDHGSLRRHARISVLGAVAPAAIGALSVVLGNLVGSASALAQMLAIWSVVGFLTLSDLGLMRTSAQRVSNGEDGRQVAKKLVRHSVAAGLVIGLALVAFLSIAGPDLKYPLPITVCLALLPPVMLAQFPVIGALEASGRFGIVAINKGLSAVTTYAAPAALLYFGDLGAVCGLAVMLVYRIFGLGWTYRALPHNPTGGHLDSTGAHNSYRWIAASSVIGPVFLYADRLAIGAFGPQSLWIFYSTVSEILLRSYIVPTSLVAALFPWTVRRLVTAPHEVSKIYARWLPAGTICAATLAALVAFLVPHELLTTLGVQEADLSAARVTAAVLVAGTAINWSSQAQIALLHALNLHRPVFVVQAIFLVPYLIALYVAMPSGIAAISAVWFSRIALNWVCLAAMIRAGLRAESMASL